MDERQLKGRWAGERVREREREREPIGVSFTCMSIIMHVY